jgi:peroxiredoxin
MSHPERIENPTTSHSRSAERLPWGRFAFVAILFAIGLFYLGWALFRPASPTNPGKDVAEEARAYLRERAVRPLSEPLGKLLDQPERFEVKTQPHALLGKRAPDFELEDTNGQLRKLHSLLRSGPVVLVFYYGYYCNHCVGQLFALEKDLPLFHELGAEVLAVSADPPSTTRQRFLRYGEFHFPVLSDPGNTVAQQFGAYQPARPGKEENLDHATFIIDTEGIVRWSQFGDEPFTNDRALLIELARVAHRLPTGPKR